MDDRLIAELAMARLEKETVKAGMKRLVDAVTSQPGYKELEITLARLVEKESTIASEIREKAEEEFNSTGIKQVHKNVLVKEKVLARIADENSAREWCFTNFRPALLLDEETFLEAIKNKQVPEHLGECFTELSVNISRDLSEYLPKTDSIG